MSDLRSKYGWGGANIPLAMAQRLYAMDPRTYPTMEQALQKIGGLRADKMGWGKMAHQLGFQLGPVVSAAERQLHAQDVHLVHSQKVDRAAKIELSEHVDRPERSDKPPHSRQ